MLGHGNQHLLQRLPAVLILLLSSAPIVCWWLDALALRSQQPDARPQAEGGEPVDLDARVTLSDGSTGRYVFGPDVKDELLRAEHANLDEVRDLARAKVHYVASDTTGVVCFPTSANARRITPAHRHGFRTLTQARSAGYRPCKRCQPAPATA